MKLSSFQEIVNFAIEREEEAYKAYGRMIEIVKTPGLRKLLSELQAEEKEHKRLLQNISKEKIESLEIKNVEDMKISDPLQEEKPSENMNFQDLLILAAKKEQNAIDLYTSLGKKVKTGELKKLFDFLVQQEKSHKLRLEDEYEKHVLEGY
jgi:rubrerythrin